MVLVAVESSGLVGAATVRADTVGPEVCDASAPMLTRATVIKMMPIKMVRLRITLLEVPPGLHVADDRYLCLRISVRYNLAK